MNKPCCMLCRIEGEFYEGEQRKAPEDVLLPYWFCPRCLHQLVCRSCKNVLRGTRATMLWDQNICYECLTEPSLKVRQ